MSYRPRQTDFPPLQRGYPGESTFLPRAYPPPSLPWDPPLVFSPVGPPPHQNYYHPVIPHPSLVVHHPMPTPPTFALYGRPLPQQFHTQPVFPSTLPPPDQRHWLAIPQTLHPRRAQRQQGPVHTPHIQRKDQVASSSAAGKPRKMVLERQELQAKATKTFHLLPKSELRKSNWSVGPLSRDNYKEKFHHLLYWEEHEHEVVLRDRCSGSYCVCLNSETGTFLPKWLLKMTYNMCIAEIWGMFEDQCDYAKQAATDATLRLRSTTIKCQIQHAGLSDDGDPILFISLPDNPPAELRGTSFPWNPNAEVRFVLKHSYFQNLHRAVECLSDATLAKLLPQPKDLKEYREYTQRVRMRRPELPQFRLDYDFQFNAMKNILYSAPCAPFLVTGPFGTGKTRMLATAAYMFLMGDSAPQPVTRILLATHHSQTADSYLDNYFGPAAKNGNMQGVEILRLVPNDRAYRYDGSYKDCIKSVSSVKHRLDQYQLVISTLLTTPHLVAQGGCYPGFFSHILVDEAAQTREPELTAALSLAAENTKLVFAGDHLQVGPETLVLGEEALKNGLDQSLLKRLHTLYQSKEYSNGAEMYTASLLTNWRNHREIVKLVSKLFYRDTLQSRSYAKLPPGTTYPLHFICTSTAHGQECILADEEDLKEEGEKEAAAVLEAVQKYCIPWPRMEWGPKDMDSICIIAPSRMQQRIIRKNLKRFGIPREVNTEVAFDIQGREYRAVFLCTSEPVLEDGSTANPTKSICDKFVFTTVITRAQSLVVAVGNPYRLFGIEEKNPNGAGCWKEYVTQCFKKYTVQGFNLKKLQKVLRTSPDVPEEETEDLILDRYCEIKTDLPQKTTRLDQKQSARAQMQVSLRPGRMFSKTGSVSSMQRKRTNFGPAGHKVKKVAHPNPTKATSSASGALLHPTVTQSLTSSGQRSSSGNQHKTVAASAMTSDDDFPLLTKSQLEKKDHLLSEQLSRDNYKEKFHHLLYWEEHEHETVLKDRCNGVYDVELFSDDLSQISRKLPNYEFSHVIQILGMTVDQCEYAMQAATEGRAFLDCSTLTGYIGGMGIAKDGQPVLYLALNDFLQELKISPRVPHVQVEFLLKHSYFQNLHRAVNWLPDAGVKKLLPEVNDLEVYVKQQKCKKLQMANFALDYEYQFDALLKILSATPKAPFIVSGPFGTGKTKLLATAALRFLQGEGCSSVARPRILLAAHHLQTADSYLDQYFGPAKRSKQMRGVRLVRLVVNSRVYQYRGRYPGFVKAANREKEKLGDYQLIITTLLTTLQLKWHCEGLQPGFFTHILVDEAAQAREPELTAVLSLADEHTKVVLGGDHLQVGPRTLVLGKAAKENGLGVSVLERLHCLYHTPEYLQNAEAYSASLLTNYRCHPGILRLPSHLFYDATLQCNSTSKLHPKTHQPLHFICTSLKQGESCVLAKEADLIYEGRKEAIAALDAVKKYCTEYPKEWGSDLRDMSFLENICIVTPWKKQQNQVLNLLQSAKYRQLKGVDHTVAYAIQGRQYRAVFLCTSEPVLADGSTANPTKSICDKSVFNTVITRAQSLVVAVGNPFRLFHIEERCANGAACWKEYVRNCMQCQSLDVIAERDRSALNSLQEVVFESLSKQLKAREPVVDSGDSILEAYNAELSKKSHSKKAKIALRSFGGDRGWTVWTEENPQKKEIRNSPKKINSDGLQCRLEQKTYRKCIAQPLDPTLKEIILQGVNNRRCAFDNAIVEVQTLHEGGSGEQYGRVTDVVEQGEAKQFVCRVDQYNAIFFFPVDGKSPKIVNLPQLARTLVRLECPDDISRDQLESGRHDVMCFDPESVKQGKVPKVQESIPLDIAVHLLFVVWPINWDKEHRWPLGVVVGAIPKGETFFHAERLLRVQYEIDDPDPNFDGIPAEDSATSMSNLPTVGHPHWEGAITIDPEGAINLDDALTLTEVEITEDGSTLLEYGVHIANVGRYLPHKSELDERILEKCTSVYGRCQGVFKFQPMLPKEFSSKLSLDPLSARFCISVTSKAIRSIDGNLQLLEESVGVQISEDTVRSMLKITYTEAETLLRISDGYSIEEDSLPERVKEYNQSAAEQNQLTCQERLNLLGRIAQSLRSKRLGQAGIACPLSDYDTERHPQAHFLVSELMIWANACVAKRLLESHLPTVLLRVQPPPNQQKIEMILEEFSSVIASTSLFPGLQPHEKEVHMTCPYIMLTDVKDELVSYLKDGKLQLAQTLLCSLRRHPQLAVLETHCARAQNRAQYKLLRPHHNEDESTAIFVKHHTLNTEYTHFTSPIRRAADVVVQRMLLKMLDGVDSTLEDSVEELKNSVQKFNLMSANARRYENGLSVLDTAMYASRSSICTTAYISSVASGSVELIYADHVLSDISPRNRTVKESILIPPSYDGRSGPEQCIWKVRMASLQCSTPINFTVYESKDLSKPRESAQLQVNEESRITLFVPSDEKEVGFNSCSVVAKHKKTAILISPNNWESVQKFICDTGSVTAAQVLSALSDEATILEDTDEEVVKDEEEEVVEEEDEEEDEEDKEEDEDEDEKEEGVDERASVSVWNGDCCLLSKRGEALVSDLDHCNVADKSLFCVLEVPISLNVFKDYKIWLTCSSGEHMLTVKVQLMEMAPHLHICVQHRANPVACFTDVTPKQASKPEYNSIEEYCELWIDTYLAECAASSTDDSKKNGKMIIVQNVPLHWPKLEIPANVYGEPYCHPKGELYFVIPKDFVAELSDFFQVEPGCLVCVRYEIQLGQRERDLLMDICKKRFGDLIEGEDHVKRLLGNCSDGYARAVFHMVVRKVVKVASKSKDDSSNSETVPLRVTLTMKGESKVSLVMAALLSSQQYTCDMELCALTIPSERVFRSLVELEDTCKSDHKAVENILLKSIVLGDIPTLQNLYGFPPRIVDEFLASNHAVTHLWDVAAHDQRGGTLQGRKNATPLNGEQVEAIRRSLVNRFQLIQGPPGTGKSVTGAHLAFAFALLNKAERKTQLMKRPCVLYCGPSNKSVEVVLRLLKPMSDKVNILSIYGKMIEELDYPAPLTGSMGPNAKRDHKCPDDLQEFALHHKVHRLSSRRGAILNLESTLRRLHDRGSIPNAELRRCYKKTIAEAEQEIIHKGEFDIVLCTCSEAASRRVNNTLAPVQCIIDEAAMAMEPECLAAVSKAYHVVLIGDHKQLQPVIDNRKAKENGLGISLFERYARLGTDGSTPTLPFITLRVQYRMQLAVCWFPSEHFYETVLRPHETVAKATAPGLETFWPNAKWPIVFCDVDGHEDGNTGTQKSGKDSKSNKNEAAQVAKIVDVLLNKYSVCPEDVAVLTPYTAQKKLLERELTNKIKVKVRTVTESQGSEFKLVILSTVRSQPAKDIENEEVVQADRHWMLENLGFITDEHQICVGITRSRLGLVIVGNACLLQYNDTWKRLLEHYKKKNCLVKGKNFPKRP